MRSLIGSSSREKKTETRPSTLNVSFTLSSCANGYAKSASMPPARPEVNWAGSMVQIVFWYTVRVLLVIGLGLASVEQFSSRQTPVDFCLTAKPVELKFGLRPQSIGVRSSVGAARVTGTLSVSR